jgi:outer membrane protein assembly factor BamB
MKYTLIQDNTKKRKPQILAFFLTAILIGVWALWISSPGKGVTWPPPVTNHSSSDPELWSLSNIYINVNLRPMITAFDNKLAILGSNDISREANVIVFDAITGHILWTVPRGGISISSTSSMVIVGGAGEVVALDGNDGKTLWDTTLRANVTQIILKDNLLYVFGAASNRYYVLNPANGNILKKLEGSYSIAQEPSLENIAYLKQGSGDVLAVDKTNDQELWRVQANAISNLAVTQAFIYALARDGNLLKIDHRTGLIENMVIFSPSPFMLHSNGEGGFTIPYYVAVESDVGILFVYLGDSRQLFAFKIE